MKKKKLNSIFTVTDIRKKKKCNRLGMVISKTPDGLKVSSYIHLMVLLFQVPEFALYNQLSYSSSSVSGKGCGL